MIGARLPLQIVSATPPQLNLVVCIAAVCSRSDGCHRGLMTFKSQHVNFYSAVYLIRPGTGRHCDDGIVPSRSDYLIRQIRVFPCKTCSSPSKFGRVSSQNTHLFRA
ncbi:hypothetical protein BKA82DRAFT_374002 [Pisolithus tinctorius]|uniref:Uncharacterized protein n=1 Tax=Pisolithus tinctorius Marx 270 TaxID=870435 RepID=A0A0C3JAD5_PISTI|nr:hypothetical protein BKA82DRAFT_374002 [Pisolithus tinctorius]KIN94641.1 hypothetical protein M404DRAFT_374002 [Pisolithus tinctorius Marx 270]